MVAPSITENLQPAAYEIRGFLQELLLNHSAWEDRNPKGASIVVITPNPYHWSSLGTEGRRLQSRLMEKYDRFHGLMATLVLSPPTLTTPVLGGSGALQVWPC